MENAKLKDKKGELKSHNRKKSKMKQIKLKKRS